MHVLSAHLAVGEGVAIPGVLGAAQGVLKERFGLAHATLQVEPCDGPGCDDINW
jgi:cobalt-zinc-cadmium efflux system protein